MKGQSGEITLVNTKTYPFHDEGTLVALARWMPDRSYTVRLEVLDAEGEAGEVRACDLARNGFQIRHTGPAARVRVRYTVEGGGTDAHC